AILRAFGASENTIGYARDYMVVILAGNVFSHAYLGLNAILRAVGHPRTAMATTLTAIGVNAVLDFLFIYVFNWGIRGAAVATIVSQTIALAWQMKILTNKNELIHLCKETLRLSSRLVRRILEIGMSPFLMHLASCTVVIFLNKGLGHYSGDLAVGAYGIANSIILLFAMIVFGFNQGMQPIVGFNYGAKDYQRMKEILMKTIFCATVVTTASFLVGLACPELIARIFTTDKELIGLAAKSYRTMVIAFPIVGFQMVTTNFFQSVGMAGKSIFLSLTRQLLFLLPCILVLPLFFGADGVLASIPVSDGVSSVLAGFFLYRQMKHLKIEMS
ncbi:MAG: MATE family efflux transporter, partial [Bacteroidales bacterium]|nr:MATE family efflux transporter [Bacteroidales bacterium]